MKKTIETDIVIVGGGIAGLWLLNRLRQQGYCAILLEGNRLGGGQTNKSQGIIHGGMKYALQGTLTSAATSIAEMPQLWRDCLEGKGAIDLSQVPMLSRTQYLWSTSSLGSKLAGFFAGFTLKGGVQELKPQHFPPVFQSPQFKGQIYSLDEMVLDVPALIRELIKYNQDVIFKIDPLEAEQIQFKENGELQFFEIHAEPLPPLEIHAQKYIFTAGAGNELILKSLQMKGLAMQRRPLHMVWVKPHFAYEIYAHCLGLSMTPRITITTHKDKEGKVIWYLGGQLAEEGVKRNKEDQIAAARKELAELFPWLDFSNAEFETFIVERAEALQQDGKRPDSCYMQEIENVIAAWPTKLALAPKLAEDIIASLNRQQIKPLNSDLRGLRAWPFPVPATAVWEEVL